MRKALLKIQVGPVQEFIAQARSTRDLWSGSYLLSWLIAHAIQGVRAADPLAELIYPNIDKQRLFDWLRNPVKLSDAEAESLLIPNLPNRFLVVTHHSEPERVAQAAADTFGFSTGSQGNTTTTSEWQRICDECDDHLRHRGLGLTKDQLTRWNYQVSHFWQISWQVWPILSGDELAATAARVPLGAAGPGGWAKNHHLLGHRLDGSRALHRFSAWQGTPLVHKDHFSGKEEAVADAGWVAQARQKKGIGHLFRNDDELGAVNLIKRVWHLARLSESLPRARTAFDSAPAVAIAPWRKELARKVLSPICPPELEQAFFEFANSVVDALDGVDSDVAESVRRGDHESYKYWFERADAAVFHPSSWLKWEGDAADVSTKQQVQIAKERLKNLQLQARLGPITAYYAVLAMDGDEMGQWLTGKNTTDEITQQWHSEFSGKLSKFATGSAQKIVEQHDGQLIYAGGDDVLAMLPASRAMACAIKLREEFGAILTPGQLKPLTASIGLAIGHIKEPLQDMVEAALRAERQAKGRPLRLVFDHKLRRSLEVPAARWNRDALAVTLFKRSGETVEWGAKFNSSAFRLWSVFQRNFRTRIEDPNYEPPISSRFPHRLISVLSRYDAGKPLSEELMNIAVRDFSLVAERQAEPLPETERAALVKSAVDYLRELHEFSWTERNPKTRKTEERRLARPLAEFYHLFALESFISRQLD